jgi:N utilization substance protein B
MILNRRHLRVKVLQVLYAWEQTEGATLEAALKELDLSIQKVYDLYLTYLSLLAEIPAAGNRRIEELKNKRIPDPDEEKAYGNFLTNPVLNALSVNLVLRKACEQRKINWVGNQDILKNLLQEIRKGPYFDLLSSGGSFTFEQFVESTSHVFIDHIANSEWLQNELEERSIFWVNDMDLVCAMVVKTIKECSENSDEYKNILLPLYKDAEEDSVFIKELLKKTIIRTTEVNEVIDNNTDNWDLERIALMDRLIMRMAIVEVMEFSSIPVKVTLNEYIDISKFYSTPKSNTFINGVLDKAFAELKRQNKINKTGRGLVE